MQNVGEDGDQPIDWVVESKGLLVLEQCGFREKKNWSTANHQVHSDIYIHNAFAKKNTLLPFSLIWKKFMTSCGNTVWYLIFTTLIYVAICLPSSKYNVIILCKYKYKTSQIKVM